MRMCNGLRNSTIDEARAVGLGQLIDQLLFLRLELFSPHESPIPLVVAKRLFRGDAITLPARPEQRLQDGRQAQIHFCVRYLANRREWPEQILQPIEQRVVLAGPVERIRLRGDLLAQPGRDQST